MADQWLIKRFRDELRLTQWDLATAANLTQIRISELERGIDEPASFEQDRIVKALVKYSAAHELENYLFQARFRIDEETRNAI